MEGDAGEFETEIGLRRYMRRRVYDLRNRYVRHICRLLRNIRRLRIDLNFAETGNQ